MKKRFSLLIVLSLFLTLVPNLSTASNSEDTYFIVTAYYSPLPDQKSYLKWNYEAEKRLNWEGIRWASGKEVFSGMLAAPKNYAFGTKIYLEWLGIWEVADRGGAIVNAWKRGYEHDRIDVWMWYGDEWLQRALYWGKRKVKWNILNSSSKVDLDYSKLPSPTWATKNLTSIPSIFNMWLWNWSNSDMVKKLQEFLSKINLYNWEIDWKYNSNLIDVIYNFQLDNNLIEAGQTYGAWYWWTTTRNLILKKYLNWEFDEENNEEQKDQLNDEKKSNTEELNIFNNPVETKEEIMLLQKRLTDLSLYTWAINWVYNDVADIITKYQLEGKIISKIWDAWTWYFGPKTRAALKEDYEEYLKQKELEEQLKKQEEARRRELEKKFQELEDLAKKEAKEKINSIWTPSIWEVSPRVRELQNLLKDLGYFEHKDTAIFWPVTKKAIISYQLEKWIIENENETWAWICGPKTRDSLINDLKEKYLTEKLEENSELAELKIEIETEEDKQVSIDTKESVF